MGAPDFFALWGVPFVLVGLYLVFGRFVIDLWLRRATRYELTDRRLIIERSGWFPKTTTLFVADLPPMSLKERSSGRGTVRFGDSDLFGMFGSGIDIWSPAMDRTPQLLNIDRAEEVFDMIQRQQDAQWAKQS